MTQSIISNLSASRYAGKRARYACKSAADNVQHKTSGSFSASYDSLPQEIVHNTVTGIVNVIAIDAHAIDSGNVGKIFYRARWQTIRHAGVPPASGNIQEQIVIKTIFGFT